MENIQLWHGDCLELMKNIPDKSIDMVLTDPSYGTTACKWDTVIPFEPMWEYLKRITKDNGVICLFGSEPFSSHLRLSNLKMFKYDWIWHKSRPSGIAQARYMPMKSHEIISVFAKSKTKFFPIKETRQYNGQDSKRRTWKTWNQNSNHGLGETKKKMIEKLANPKTVQFFKSISNFPKGSCKHPTQKPVALLEYLIKTYTIEGEAVLDFTMGSGSTGVACKNLNRKFIGIEKDDNYFNIAKERINLADSINH